MYSECFLQVCEVWLEVIGHKTVIPAQLREGIGITYH